MGQKEALSFGSFLFAVEKKRTRAEGKEAHNFLPYYQNRSIIDLSFACYHSRL
jgi:hypothetical protein